VKLVSLILGIFLAFNAQAITFDQDVPKEIQDQFQADLSVVQSFEGKKQTPFHQEIFESMNGQKYSNFITDRVFSVGIDDCGGGAGTMACVQPFLDAHKMWLTKNLITGARPQAARIMIIFHEARHTEEDNVYWFHATCPTPYRDENGKDYVGMNSGIKLEGLDACDSKAFGSYGFTVILLKNLAKYCETCSEKFKMDADIYSNDQIHRFHLPEVKKQVQADLAK